MYYASWREAEPGGDRYHDKGFATEERRQDFFDTLTACGTRYEILSQSTADSHELSDFKPGMRVFIRNALHRQHIGHEATVERTVKRRHMVCLKFDLGGTYDSYPWNLDILNASTTAQEAQP